MVCWLLRFGIIPAYAGNTTLLVCPCADGGDHPRVCGEHETYFNQLDGIEGSSPRMRGTLTLVWKKEGETGIIPAYAGNTPP